MKINILGPSYIDSANDISSQRSVNLYLEENEEEGAVSARAMRHTPGLTSVIALGSDAGFWEIRGSIVVGGRMFVVRGSKFIELTYTSGTDTMSQTVRGTLTSGTKEGAVYLAANASQIMIVDGSSEGDVFNYGDNTYTNITDTDFEGAVTVVSIDSYFLYHKPNSSLMYASAVADGTDWNALDTATAEFRPDNLIGLGVLNGELWAFGENSIEVWYNAANETGFPFSRRGNLVADIGCGAAGSICTFNNMIMWLSENGQVYMSGSTNYSSQPVSKKSIERRFNAFSTFSDARSYAYNDEGHWFYVLTFPTADETWVYDVSVNAWHERAWRDPVSGLFSRHRGQVYGFLNGNHFVGDYSNGKVYRMSTDIYTDDTNPIIRQRTSAFLTEENKRVTVDDITLKINTGVGLTGDGAGSDPHIMFQYSKDSGRTWSPEFYRSIGTIGEYRDRVHIPRLGQARVWVFRISYSEPTPFTIMDAYVRGSLGDS